MTEPTDNQALPQEPAADPNAAQDPVAPPAPAQAAKPAARTKIAQTTTPPLSAEEAARRAGSEDTEQLWQETAPLESVELEMEYSSPERDLYDTATPLKLSGEYLVFHSDIGDQVDARIRRFHDPIALRSGRGRDWNEAMVMASTQTSFKDGALLGAVNDPKAKWKQYLQTETGKLGYAAPVLREKDVAAYTGEKALLRVRNLLGLGGITYVPLFHSGFWVAMTTPSDGALIELRRRLMQDKIDLGRLTFGLLYSNEQSYLNSWMYEFCMEHLYETSVRVDNPATELRDLIKTPDLNILFWGMACLAWPRGFDYIRPLTTAEGVENTQSVTAKVNITKFLWVDNSSFTKEQAAHMARRQRGSVTIEEVLKYQENFMPTLSQGRRIKINDDVGVLISTPTVTDYIQDGEVWVSNIVRAVDATFTTTAPDEDQRAASIELHSRATRLRNYGAWVKGIYIGEELVEERDVVNGTLEALSQDDEHSKLLEDAVKSFMDDSTRALIAIPSTNGKQSGIPRFANLIPVDVINTFFTLLAQRVSIISRR